MVSDRKTVRCFIKTGRIESGVILMVLLCLLAPAVHAAVQRQEVEVARGPVPDEEATALHRGIYEVQLRAIDPIGRDMAKNEPWKTLITNHQSRFKGYAFVDAQARSSSGTVPI